MVTISLLKVPLVHETLEKQLHDLRPFSIDCWISDSRLPRPPSVYSICPLAQHIAASAVANFVPLMLPTY